MATELSDADVFAAPAQMSDADVFGTPPTAVQTTARGLGLGARDVIEGTLGGPYNLIAKGINATGLLPPINQLGDNLTKLGLPAPQTPTERAISDIDQPIASTLVHRWALDEPCCRQLVRPCVLPMRRCHRLYRRRRLVPLLKRQAKH